jgi:putative transposase
VPKERRRPGRALTDAERSDLIETMNSPEFCDVAPRQIWASLLDRGQYKGHWRTMYRFLAENDEVQERRDQLRHPEYEKPELLATRPNELWSWDITKLRGPEKWTCYYLYLIMDVFSRYVVGWMIAENENATLASELIEVTCRRQGVDREELTIHADRGSPMTSKTVAQLLVDLGVEKSHSRPHVSNDNPYSESQFKTMKYHPGYPKRFGSIMDARNWVRKFIAWYNEYHHHSGIGLMPPKVVHYGEGEKLRAQRALVLEAAYAAHPERFVRGKPEAPALPEAVWINKPVETDQTEIRPHESEVVIQPKSERTSGDGMPEEIEIPLLTTYINQQTLDEAADSKARA